MYDDFSTVYSDYLANNQTGVTRPVQPKTPGKVIIRWQRKSGVFDVSHNVSDYKALQIRAILVWGTYCRGGTL